MAKIINKMLNFVGLSEEEDEETEEVEEVVNEKDTDKHKGKVVNIHTTTQLKVVV
jgi:hypothetical protein